MSVIECLRGCSSQCVFDHDVMSETVSFLIISQLLYMLDSLDFVGVKPLAEALQFED